MSDTEQLRRDAARYRWLKKHISLRKTGKRLYHAPDPIPYGRMMSLVDGSPYAKAIQAAPLNLYEHELYCGKVSIADDERDLDTIIDNAMFSEVTDPPSCCVCGTTENVHKDGWYGYRCDSDDCMVF